MIVERARTETVIFAPGLPGRMLGQGEISALLEACERDRSHRGPRDALVIALGVSSGLRRAEICGLDVWCILGPESHPISVVVKGKGGRFRLAYLYDRSMHLLFEWMQVRRSAFGGPGRGWKPGPLVVSSSKGGEISRARLTPGGLWRALRRRQEEAGIAAFSPHDLRRTFISNLLDQGVDLALVARLAGHRSVITTSMYDRRPEKAAKAAAVLAQLPPAEVSWILAPSSASLTELTP